MEEQVKNRLKALYSYTSAVENGDSDTITAVLQQANNDAGLERMILEVNEVYQKEEGAVAHADDVAEAQELLLAVFTNATSEPTGDEIGTPAIPSSATTSAQSKQSVGDRGEKKRESGAALASHKPQVSKQKRWPRRHPWQLAAAAIILIGLLIATIPGTGALANQFLALFRVQHVQPVSVDEANPLKVARELYGFMTNFGDVEGSTTTEGQPLLTSPTSELSLDQLKQAVHFQPALPTSLPDGVGHVAQYSISTQIQISFVFKSEKAKSYLQKTGQSDIVIPAQLEGAKFTLKLDPGLLISYYDSCQPVKNGKQQCSGGKSFAISEIPSPVLQSTGSTTLNDLRSFFLSLPKLSDTERTILQHADVNSGTVPVPIPTGINSQQVSVNGASGLQLSESNTSLLTWQANNIVYAIAALDVPAEQVLATANTMH